MVALERKCKNCGSSIGGRETPHVWQGHVVCAGCITELAGTSPDELTSSDVVVDRPPVIRSAPPVVVARGIVRCPRCGSDDTQKLSVIHARSSQTPASDDTTGEGEGDNTGLPANQTGLASEASPPDAPKEPIVMFVVLLGLGIVAVGAVAFAANIGNSLDRGLAFVGVVIAGVGIAVIIGAIRNHAQQAETRKSELAAYRKEMALWNRRYGCLRCGRIYIPDGE
jgi:hypothetical protein